MSRTTRLQPRTSASFPAVRRLLPLFALLLWAACSPDRERIAIDDGRDGFTIGDPASYPVSGGSGTAVEDSVSGATFLFPGGADGELAVSRIVSSPIAEPDSADGFLVTFTTDDRIHILLPRAEDREPLLWAYAIPATSTYAPLDAAGAWLPVMPTDTLSNPAVFELYELGAATSTSAPRGTRPLAAAPAARPPQSYFFMRRYITRDGWEWQNMHNIRLITEWTIRDAIAALPGGEDGGMQGAAMRETQGRLALRAWKALASPDVSAYSAFEYWARGAYRRLYPKFSFVATGANRATESTVAHEVGHYMSHVFLGDEGFEELSGQLRRSHEFGEPHAERPMLEEYAQFTDYFKNGNVGGTIPVEELFRALRLRDGGATPRDTDWPSMEGYATCLLVRLHMEGNSIVGQSGGPEEIPALFWPFSKVFGFLYAAKPLTVNQLRAALAIALEADGEADRLAPILERTGWSYHGKGVIRNAQGKAVQGAWVRSKCRVPSEAPDQVYYAPLVPIDTDATGGFSLGRIFPGQNLLEVVLDDVVHEFPITVDPNRPTTDEIDLGVFTIQDSLIDRLKLMNRVRLTCAGEFDLDNGGMEVRMFTTAYDEAHPVTWKSDGFTWAYSDSSQAGVAIYGESMDCTVSFSADGRTVAELTCHLDEWQRAFGKLTHTRTSDITVRNLPLSFSDTTSPGHRFAHFTATGASIQPLVASIRFVERYYTDAQVVTNTATTFRWTGSAQSGYLELSLRDSE